MNEKTRVGVFGGSFNPPHIAHVLAVTYVLSVENLDRVIVVPCFDHPLGKTLEPFEHRYQMCKLAFRDLFRVKDSLSTQDRFRVEVSRIEQKMGAVSRTLYTLQKLKRARPHEALHLVVGADILGEKGKWFEWDKIVEIAPPIVLGRIGFPHDDAPLPVLPQVASRDLRAALSRGEIPRATLPFKVGAYIQKHGLYRSGVT